MNGKRLEGGQEIEECPPEVEGAPEVPSLPDEDANSNPKLRYVTSVMESVVGKIITAVEGTGQ